MNASAKLLFFVTGPTAFVLTCVSGRRVLSEIIIFARSTASRAYEASRDIYGRDYRRLASFPCVWGICLIHERAGYPH